MTTPLPLDKAEQLFLMAASHVQSGNMDEAMKRAIQANLVIRAEKNRRKAFAAMGPLPKRVVHTGAGLSMRACG